MVPKVKNKIAFDNFAQNKIYMLTTDQSITLETVRVNNDASIKRFATFFCIELLIVLFFYLICQLIGTDIIALVVIPIALIVMFFYILIELNTRDAIATGILTIGEEKIMYWSNSNKVVYYYWDEIKAVQYFFHSYNGQQQYGSNPSTGDKNYIIIQKKNAKNVRINFHLTKSQSFAIKHILHQCCAQSGTKLYLRNQL